jgi:hypothetical protein
MSQQDQSPGTAQTALGLLQAGLTPEQVVSRLVEEGTPQPQAETVVGLMVERHRRQVAATSHRDIRTGALWFIGGALLSAGSYYFAPPGQSFLLAWGPVIFGGWQFVRGWRKAGRAAIGSALRWLLVVCLLLGGLYAVSLWLPSLSRTYQDAEHPFSVDYPLTWQAKVQEDEGDRLISFTPRFGWGNDDALLEIRIEDDVDTSPWTPMQLAYVLKGSVLAGGEARIQSSSSLQLSGLSGAEVSFSMEPEGPDVPVAGWLAICPVPGATFWLGAFETHITPKGLEGRYRRFLGSFRHIAMSTAPQAAPTPEAASAADCPPGWEPYASQQLGFSVCHPLDWIAVPMPEGEAAGGAGVDFIPLQPENEGQVVSVSLELGRAEAAKLSDSDWEAAALEALGEDHIAVVGEPRISRRDGLRILEISWNDLQATTEEGEGAVWSFAWMMAEDRNWWVETIVPPSQAQASQELFAEFVSTFSALNP